MSKRPSAPATLVVAALLALAGFAAGCTGGSAVSDTTAIVKPTTFSVTDSQRARLTVITLADTTFRPSLEVTGTVAFDGDQSTQVLAPISGPVQRVLVEPGAHVTRGQPLAIVSSPDFAAAVADFRKAQAPGPERRRIADLDEQLFKNDAIARRDMEQARRPTRLRPRPTSTPRSSSSSRWARRLHGSGQLKAGDPSGAVGGVIRAPIDGTLVEKLITSGPAARSGRHALLHRRRRVPHVGAWPRLPVGPGSRAERRVGGHLRATRTPASGPRAHRLRGRPRRSRHPGHVRAGIVPKRPPAAQGRMYVRRAHPLPPRADRASWSRRRPWSATRTTARSCSWAWATTVPAAHA